MTDIEIEGGEILANIEDRTITGLLIPFNEVGRTNVGSFQVEAGVIAIPDDPAVITLNVDHDRYQPVGRATRVWQETAGIMATFGIARTPEGDTALADATSPTGKRRRLSGEFKTGIKAGRATGGHLAAAALVEQGAFPSAMVLAADSDPVTTSEHSENEYTDENGTTWRRVVNRETSTVTTDGETSTVTTITETATQNEQETEMTDPQPVAASLPPTVADAPAAVTASRMPTIQTIASAIAEVKANRAASNSDAFRVLAALSDITLTGTNSLPGDAIQPNWMGQILDGIAYSPEYITLFNPGSEIYAGGKKGWKLRRGTQAAPVTGTFDGTWAGNKTDIKSYQGFTETHGSTLARWAIGEDIGREFYDLPGGMEFVVAFLSLLQEDYLVWQDNTALATAVATAGAPVAPNTAAYPTNYPDALGQLIQGIIAVKKRKADGRRDAPSFAIVNDAAFEELIYAAGGDQNLPEFVSISLSTASNGTVDGNVKVVNGDVGIDDSPAVLVGADYSIDFDRPAGGLLEVDALDIARGGVDKAVHGYLQTFIRRPEALVLVGVADAAA